MSWSKIINKEPKLLRWWYAKIMCEIAYHLGSDTYYYYYLNRMCKKYNRNIYGEDTRITLK